MKHICEDNKQFRSLGRAMEHVQKERDGQLLYWVRVDQFETDNPEPIEAYDGYAMLPESTDLQHVTTITRR